MDKLTIKNIVQIEKLNYLNAFEIQYLNKKGAQKKWELISRGDMERVMAEINEGKVISDGAMIFATNREKTHVAMLKEYRVSAGRYIYMTPAGLCDKGESLEVTSVREFKEETGLDFEFISSAKPRYTSVGIINERVEIAYGYYSGEASKFYQSDDEDAEVIFVDKEMARYLLDYEDVSIRTALLIENFFDLNVFFDKSVHTEGQK